MKQLSLVTIFMLYSCSVAYGVDLVEMQNLALKNRKIVQRYVTSLEQSEKDILLVKGGYYPAVDIFYRANSLDEAAFQTLEKVYQDGENRYQVGLIGKNELLKFRVDYDNSDVTLKAADAGLKKSVQRLSYQV